MLLTQILISTLLAGIGSVWLAACLSYYALARFNHQLLSLAAGALLATAFIHLLPEAFEGAQITGVQASYLFGTLLVGLIFFFLLDKAELYHHGHEHGCTASYTVHHAHREAHAAHPQHHHPHHSDHEAHGGSWSILLGDGVHAFGDGIVIAAAFTANPQLGWAAALAVLAHEIPHHMGDLVVLGRHQKLAILKVSLAGTITAIGGLAGYFLLTQLDSYLPYVLVMAASSFIYVALADLIPQLQRRMQLRETLAQILWLLCGMSLVVGVTGLTHMG